ncbi:hypothetical protein VTK73DRAFT_5139 [Phialemonium thermophilum]|uniref:Elongator complex protein 6 n=1 Tax=Phialemonium thermophilum TaxID=223376 RepID=A0ABR3WPK3_9PEZI
MATRSAALLDPFLSVPPESSLILLTGILGASTNWLLLRYLQRALGLSPSSTSPEARQRDNQDGNGGSNESQEEETTVVVLASFLRDFSFWRDGFSRLGRGLDLEALGRHGRFAFVDGLDGLFAPASSSSSQRQAPTAPTRGPEVMSPAMGRRPLVPISPVGRPAGDSQKWKFTIPRSAGVREVGRTLSEAVDFLRYPPQTAAGTSGKRKVVLVIDQLDFLAAATEGEASGNDIRDMLLDLRENVHSTILTIAADDPLVAHQTTTLEREHAALALSLAHEAAMVLSLRLLDTGTAKDVSGVIRITRGGAASEAGPGLAISDENEGEKEYLYHVGGDGGLRVFERGQ